MSCVANKVNSVSNIGGFPVYIYSEVILWLIFYLYEKMIELSR